MKQNRCDLEAEDHVALRVVKTTRVPSVLVKGSANRLSFLTTQIGRDSVALLLQLLQLHPDEVKQAFRVQGPFSRAAKKNVAFLC